MLDQNGVATRIVELFNDVIKHDPEFSKALFSQEWRCNTWTSDHDDILVDKERNTARLIGLLNGIVGKRPDGSSYIKALYNKKGVVKLELNGTTKSTKV